MEKDRKKRRKDFPENMGKTGSRCKSRYLRGGYGFPCFSRVLESHGKDGKGEGKTRG
jgi:hypothetical protein